ncbi:MAG: hypothetical protein R2681_07030 [Pyrinomonadaceae bacterium]
MSNIYWNGNKHAILKKDDVSAKWISSRFGEKGLGATNKAFCIWYHGMKTYNETFSLPLLKSLESCGNTGFGMGVRDLDDAFKHLTTTGGKWTDNTHSYFGSYNGISGDYRGGTIGISIQSEDMPPSIANFLGAVDKSLAKMKDAMVVYKDQCQALAAIKLKPTSSPTDFDKVKKKIDLMKKAAESVSSYAWLAPPVIDAYLPETKHFFGMKKASEIEDAISNRANQSVKFLDIVVKITDSMKLYVEAKRAFDNNGDAGLAFGALSLAMTFVPALGGFYGEIIKKIPALVVGWRGFMDSYVSQIDNFAAYQKMIIRQDMNRWRCGECGSM